MKKYYILSLAFLAIFTLHSCEDFLQETDQDKLIPTRVEHYAALMLGEIIKINHFDSELMTDNVAGSDNSMEEARKPYKPLFTWQQEIELDEDGNKNKISTNDSWETLYKKIAIFNYVIEFSNSIEGEKEEVDFIVAEALFLRAHFMFQLNNLYGVPYVKESAAVDLGIPIRLDTGIEQTYDRATVKESYDQIISDLNAAKELFENTSITKDKWHPSLAACNFLLSRVYLYIEDWDNVINYSSKVIEDKNYNLTRPNRLTAITKESKNIIYSIGDVASIANSVFQIVYKVNKDLLDLYTEGDYRFDASFSKIIGTTGLDEYAPFKYHADYTDIGFLNFRIAEAYLNRAEAYARKSQDDLAKNDLRTLLKTRYVSESQIIISETNILNQILVERRKELCFEEHHRWFDLRRMKGEGVDIIHIFTLTDNAGTVFGTQKFILYPNDKNYTLPIPLAERENNPLIYNNERYDKLPVED